MVGAEELQSRCKTIVQYSTYMHIFLGSNAGNFIISCLRGRSRSPCVILCFLILFRGFNTERGIEYLTKAFRDQRPTMARSSSNDSKNFPNLRRYLNIFSYFSFGISFITFSIFSFNFSCVNPSNFCNLYFNILK